MEPDEIAEDAPTFLGPDMEFCTVYRDGEYWSCDTVSAGHRHGTSSDGHWRHVQGARLPGDRVVMFGMMRGHWTPEGIPVSEPCGHGPMVEEVPA
jgi:hypothetical protein